jgi:hypothetical protein
MKSLKFVSSLKKRRNTMIVYEPNKAELVRDLMDCYATRFTYGAAHAMVEWIEEVYTDSTFKWDPVGIGCDFTEYASLEEWGCQYFLGRKSMILELGCTDDDLEECLFQYAVENQTLIQVQGTERVIVTNY